MEYEIQFLTSFVAIQVVGGVTVQGIAKLHDALVYDVRWHPGLPILFDYGRASTAGLDRWAVERMAAVTRAHGPRLGSGRCAVVVGSEVGYGIMRMHELLCDDVALETFVFRDFPSALRWLGLDAGHWPDQGEGEGEGAQTA